MLSLLRNEEAAKPSDYLPAAEMQFEPLVCLFFRDFVLKHDAGMKLSWRMSANTLLLNTFKVPLRLCPAAAATAV